MSVTDWLAKVRDLVPAFAERAARHDRDGSFPFDNFDDLRAAGLLAMTVPREYGGGEASLTEYLRVVETVAAADASTAAALTMHLRLFGAQREGGGYPQHWFEQFCRGAVEHGWLVNTAATEEGLGSPAGGGMPDTTAVRTPTGWRIDGRKSFTTMAPALHFFVVMARVDPAGQDGKPGTANFVVYRDDPGVRIDETWDTLGMRATGSHDLVLEEVELPEDRFVNKREPGGAEGKGPAAMVWFALGVSATAIGVAQAARDYAVEYARIRTPNSGRTIKEYPGVRLRVGRIEVLLQRARAMVYDAAGAWERRTTDGLPPPLRVAAAKVDAMDACIEAVDLAMRVVGGVSLQKRRPIERYYRDVRAGLYNPPIEDRALEMIAKAALD